LCLRHFRQKQEDKPNKKKSKPRARSAAPKPYAPRAFGPEQSVEYASDACAAAEKALRSLKKVRRAIGNTIQGTNRTKKRNLISNSQNKINVKNLKSKPKRSS